MGVLGRLKMVSVMGGTLAVFLSACVTYTQAQTCSSTDAVLNTPTTCCPKSGYRCIKVQYSEIKDSETCHWTNLVQQTAEFGDSDNYGYKNTFPCVGAWCLPSASNMVNAMPDDVTPAYYAQISTSSTGATECADADTNYKEFNKALSKYNCENSYSHWTCNDCRKAYARWSAAIALPACAIGSGQDGITGCTAIKPCIRLCNEVVQKCPITLGFKCPAGGEGGQKADYTSRDTKYCTTFKHDELTGPNPVSGGSPSIQYTTASSMSTTSFTTDCCNSMGLQSGAVPLKLSAVTSMFVVLCLWFVRF